jgi:hypothetical protein
MVLAQIWSALHKSQLALHRVIGKSALLLFPFLIDGMSAIIDVTANKFVEGQAPNTIMAGGYLMLGLLLGWRFTFCSTTRRRRMMVTGFAMGAVTSWPDGGREENQQRRRSSKLKLLEDAHCLHARNGW